MSLAPKSIWIEGKGMWLFANTGFVSAVSNGEDLMVRARDRESLGSLAETTKQQIRHTPKNYYPYRLVTSHEIFAKWVAHMAAGINYMNFKLEVAATRGYDFAHPLSEALECDARGGRRGCETMTQPRA